MDGWQKLEIISKVLAAILVPLTIAYLGNEVAKTNKQRDSETKFVELATAILSRDANEPWANLTPGNKNLRIWAVDVINKFSGVTMSKETADALIQSTASFPQISAVAQDSGGTWGVIFGGDTTLDAAKHEVTNTAKQMGIGSGVVFRRAGSYRSVKIFVSRAEAEDALGKARAVRPGSYIVNMLKWCPASEQKQDYFECSAV